MRRLVLTESNIPGVTAFASAGHSRGEMANLKSWQFAFNRLTIAGDLSKDRASLLA